MGTNRTPEKGLRKCQGSYGVLYLKKRDDHFGGIGDFMTGLCILDPPSMGMKLCFRKMTADYISQTSKGF